MDEITPAAPPPSTRPAGDARRSSDASGGPWLHHLYGPHVHVLDCPWTNGALARLSRPECTYTELVAAVRATTVRLLTEAIAREFPTADAAVTTRMAEKHGDRGTWRGRALSADADIVVLDVIRGGMLPAQACFEHLALSLPTDRLRLAHLSMERIAGDDGRVERVDLNGAKLHGSLEGACLIVPDPMGATGSTLQRALEYAREHNGAPATTIALPLIATPEFIRTATSLGGDVRVYAGRLDRGTSPPEVLAEVPGTSPDLESGLDGDDYIVPGAGGLGELLSNSWG